MPAYDKNDINRRMHGALEVLKHDLAGLRSSVIRQHALNATLLSFFRGEPGTGEVLAVFNQSGSAQPFTLPAGSWSDAAAGGAPLSGTIDVPARGWFYLVRQ
jgi:hypothetical protein